MPGRLLISRAGLVALVTLSGFWIAPASAMPETARPHASVHALPHAPSHSPPHAPLHAPAAIRAVDAPRAAAARLVDINSASRAELKTLPGIDDAAAARIVAARPYPSKAKLVADQVISEPLFMSLKHHIVAIQKPAPAAHGAARAGSKP